MQFKTQQFTHLLSLYFHHEWKLDSFTQIKMTQASSCCVSHPPWYWVGSLTLYKAYFLQSQQSMYALGDFLCVCDLEIMLNNYKKLKKDIKELIVN